MPSPNCYYYCTMYGAHSGSYSETYTLNTCLAQPIYYDLGT